MFQGYRQETVDFMWGIGFNNLAYAYDAQTHRARPGLAVLPIDIDGDGDIGPEESFYDSKEQLVNAIELDKFPAPPARTLLHWLF